MHLFPPRNYHVPFAFFPLQVSRAHSHPYDRFPTTRNLDMSPVDSSFNKTPPTPCLSLRRRAHVELYKHFLGRPFSRAHVGVFRTRKAVASFLQPVFDEGAIPLSCFYFGFIMRASVSPSGCRCPCR